MVKNLINKIAVSISFMFITTIVFAEGTSNPAAANSQAPHPLASIAPFVIVFLIFYFLMIRPQKKKFEEEKMLLAGLNKGDEVYTKSGIIGVIAGLTDQVVTLEISEGVKLKILRAQIGGLAKKIFEEKKKESK